MSGEAEEFIGDWWSTQASAGEVGLERLWADDGTWSFALDPNFDSRLIVHERVVDWVYAGQRVFEPSRARSSTKVVVIEDQARTDVIDDLYATVRQDAQGRLWKASYVDAAELAAVLAEDEEETRRIYASEGGDFSLVSYAPNEDEPDPWIGETHVFEQESWANPCANGTGVHIWDSEDRNAASGELTDRQSTAVFLVAENDDESSSSCSAGQFEGEYDTVTAAHCIDDAVSVVVCKFGNEGDYWNSSYEYYATPDTSVCLEASSWEVHPNYTEINDAGDDIGLVHHGANVTIWSDWFEAGFASDSSLENTYSTLRTHGFPALKPGCSENLGHFVIDGVETTDSKFLYFQSGEIQGTPGERLTTYHDGGPGQSGSPVYYCASGGCQGGDTAFLAGVWSSWDPITTNRVSCKTNDKNDWLLGEI